MVVRMVNASTRLSFAIKMTFNDNRYYRDSYMYMTVRMVNASTRLSLAIKMTCKDNRYYRDSYMTRRVEKLRHYVELYHQHDL